MLFVDVGSLVFIAMHRRYRDDLEVIEVTRLQWLRTPFGHQLVKTCLSAEPIKLLRTYSDIWLHTLVLAQVLRLSIL